MAQVEIYTSMFCGYCSRAKQLLKRKGAPFTEISVDMKPDLRAEMRQRANGQNTVPQIFIGDVHVGGCDELYGLEGQGKLDNLLSA